MVDEQGLRLRPSQVVIRNLFRAVDSLPAFYLLGGMSCVLSPRLQRLGDIAANTIVAKTARIEPPDLEQITQGKYNSFRDYPHLVARLRQRTSSAAAAVALQALLRRGTLEPHARVQLFSRLAQYFRGLVEFPEAAVEGLSDENYTRNVVEVVYSNR